MKRLLLPRSRSLIIFLAIARRNQAFSTSINSARRLSTRLFDMPTKQVLVPIADGSEEIETTCLTDTLTRFGAHVTVASVMANQLVCRMSRGIKFEADCLIDDCVSKEWDLVVLPGGLPGAEHLRDSKTLIDILKQQKAAGKYYGAVCASPAVAFAPNGLIEEGEPVTCYPAAGFRNTLNELGAAVRDDRVVVSGKLLTSQGPGTSLEFALRLGEELYGKEKRDEIAKQMILL
ncbi:hypothetical protein MPSEU_000723700 [Mayamaea pseudoterrestris]|nr:hypothetical protein MPSEU_000723700 [Mayamaea pseudoterrestris]